MECDKEFLRKVEDMCQFDKMKKDKAKIENMDIWKEGEPGMYRKGNYKTKIKILDKNMLKEDMYHNCV